MSWYVQNVIHNPLQNSVVIVNSDNSAALTTEYHKADKLARDTLGSASLARKYYSLSGYATRVYTSQLY